MRGTGAMWEAFAGRDEMICMHFSVCSMGVEMSVVRWVETYSMSFI